MAAAVLCLVDLTFFLCLDTTFGLAVEVVVLLVAPAVAGALCGVWAAPAANIAPALNIVIMIKFFILSLSVLFSFWRVLFVLQSPYEFIMRLNRSPATSPRRSRAVTLVS